MGCTSSKSHRLIMHEKGFSEQSLKYSSRLLPLDVGHIITVVAKPLEDAEYFNLFFASDMVADEIDDIQFHMAVNFDKNCIIRNSYSKNEGWALPETYHNIAPGNIPNPIKRGTIFKIEIFIDAEMFHVSIDNKPFCIFKHRKHIKDLQRINVYGDIERIYQISHMTPKELSKVANDETLVNIIPSPQCGRALSFNGMPQGNKHGTFEINLTDDVTRRVLFQLKADFDKKKIYAVSQNEGMVWSNETILTPEEFPFFINKMFKLAIGFTCHEIVVSTDGHFSMKYPHDGELNDNPLKIEILSYNGMHMDIFSINNYSRGENVQSYQASCVYVAGGTEIVRINKDWNPAKSLQRIYGANSLGIWT